MSVSEKNVYPAGPCFLHARFGKLFVMRLTPLEGRLMLGVKIKHVEARGFAGTDPDQFSRRTRPQFPQCHWIGGGFMKAMAARWPLVASAREASKAH
jgi:hypothetical protein